MNQLITILALSSLPLTALAQSSSSSSGSKQEYLDSVCSPPVDDPEASVIPPCISVQTIESICAPKGTESTDFEASAECICKAPSTYFADWLGCRKCLQVHGAFSEQQYNAYVLQASAASSTMCQGKPTGSIADVFANAQVDGTPSGATGTSDQFPSQTAVSLYYTPDGKQGPGGTAAVTESTAEETGSNSGAEPTGTASGAGDVVAAGNGSPATATEGGSGSSNTGTAATTSSTGTSAAFMNSPLSGLASLALAGVIGTILL